MIQPHPFILKAGTEAGAPSDVSLAWRTTAESAAHKPYLAATKGGRQRAASCQDSSTEAFLGALFKFARMCPQAPPSAQLLKHNTHQNVKKKHVVELLRWDESIWSEGRIHPLI